MASLNKTSKVNPENTKEMMKGSRFGIYMGEVVSTSDVSRTGRIRVYVAALGKDKSKPHGYFDCIWVSPFAGASNYKNLDNENVESYEGTQTTYGMWMVPPDIGNIVLVAFGDGNNKYPLCMGCLLPDQYNHMVPGVPSGAAYQAPEYRTPLAEKNKFDANTEQGPGAPRPIHAPLAERITKQGLINDTVRGTTTSGAKREAPSQVFGFLTPGPLEPNSITNRLAGHQFVMDDKIDSRHIRIRSAEGNQVLLDDTNGLIYLVNKAGTAWVELTKEGDINVFGEGDINMRAKGSYNLRADKDINIEAGGDMNFKAAGDNNNNEYLGTPAVGSREEAQGYGGNIKFEATKRTDIFSANTIRATSILGDIELFSTGRTNITAQGEQGIFIKATKGDIQTESEKTTTLKAAGYAVSSSRDAAFNAPTIRLNSGGLNAKSIAEAELADQIIQNNFRDQTSEQPEFDAEGNVALTTNGERPGDRNNIKTIVGTMLTAEPYEGHQIFDSESEVPGSQEESADQQSNSIDGV